MDTFRGYRERWIEVLEIWVSPGGGRGLGKSKWLAAAPVAGGLARLKRNWESPHFCDID